MDDSDRTEPEVLPVAIPEHLVFVIEEWLEEQIRQACDTYEGEETRLAVIEAVRLYEAFGTNSLTPSEIAELAEGAADWLQPRWPKNLKDAQEVARLLTATRGLLALRDRAVAAADKQPPARVEHGDQGRVHHLSASVLKADPELVDVLRLETLMVLEDNHEPFEEVLDLPPSQLLAAAAIFRDAIAVLDTIGWLETEQTDAMDLAITPGHLAQLQRRRAEIALTLLDRLDSRCEALTEPDEIAEADEAIAAAVDLDGDLQIVGSCDLAWSAMAIHHAEDEVATLRRIRALLRPQGVVCLLERAEPMSVRLADDLGRPGIWDRLEEARSAWSERGRPALPGARNAERYPSMLASAGLDVVASRTLTSTVTAPEDPATRKFVGAQLRATVRNVADFADAADVEALVASVDASRDARWDGVTVTSSRKLFLAQPAAVGDAVGP